MGNSSYPGVPVSCLIRGKYLTCIENCVGLILCDSDFLICIHWLCFREREVNGASLSVSLPYCSDPFNQYPHASPSSVGGRWQIGPQCLKLLCTHFQSVTLCGWSSAILSPPGQTGHSGEDIHSNPAVNSLPYGSTSTLLSPTMLRWRHWKRE